MRAARRILVGTVLLAVPLALAARLAAAPALPGAAPSPGPVVEEMEAQALQWLAAQMVPNAAVPAPESSRRRLVLSYRVPPDDPVYRWVHGRSAVYDDALAAIAFTLAGRFREAEYLLGAIARLAGPDGRLWFAYNTQNDWPSDADHEGAIARTGATAWAGYALVFYIQVRSLENPGFARADPVAAQYLKAAQSIARWILARQVPAGDDPRAGLVTGGDGSAVVAFPAGASAPAEVAAADPVQWVSTEHNIDAWYFLRDLGRVTGEARLSESAERIAAGLLGLWSEGEGQFIQGIHEDRTRDTVLPLDGATWGAIFLASRGREAQAGRCLERLESRFGSRSGAARGFRPYGADPVYTDPRVNSFYFPGGGGTWADLPLVWSEGSLGAAAAFARAGRAAEAARTIEELAPMAVEGGLRYATMPVAFQFSEHPSTAGTAWLVIAAEVLRGTAAGGLFWGK